MIYNDRIKNKGNTDNKKRSTTFVLGIMTSTFVLFAFVYINLDIFNNSMEAAAVGNNTHTTSAIGTAIKSNSSSNQPNSNVSRLLKATSALMLMLLDLLFHQRKPTLHLTSQQPTK